MKIYLPDVLEGQEWILPRQMDDHELLERLSGRMQPHWRPVRMDILREDEKGNPRAYSDFPWYGRHVLMMKPRAVRLLRPILEHAGEFLPLQSDEDVSLFNVTTVVDALDEDRSSIARFDDGSIMWIDKHVLRPEAIGDVAMFRLPEHVTRVSGIYMRETVVHRIAELGLEGIAFELIWSDEAVSPKDTRVEIGRPGRRSGLKKFFRRQRSTD